MLHFAGFFTDKRFCSSLPSTLHFRDSHSYTDDHATQSYTSASFKSASNLCHCKKFAIASLAKLGHCTGCFHSLMFSTFAQVLSFQICTLHSFAYGPIVLQVHQTGFDGNPFGDAVFNTRLKLLPVDLVFLAAILVRYACTQDGTPACFLGYTPSSLAFWPSLGFETSCRGCSSYTAQPASQCLHRSSVSRIGNAAARGAASCEQSFFWKRSMDGGNRCKAAEHTIHVQHVQRGQESDTQFTDRNNITVYSVL